eukprot:CAMPEP_0194537668 /NCGR_PEP_ID=MMETSP0253-20130528/77008_1 /TAXON_ID=2966 /ORGANISM="Noctiluca scintillans" /LENGTH=110 /DNA_ID=CAMNT_0039383711 /DNA_START=393 /DNA_END=726 /DNA_ORIENTATION=+
MAASNNFGMSQRDERFPLKGRAFVCRAVPAFLEALQCFHPLKLRQADPRQKRVVAQMRIGEETSAAADAWLKDDFGPETTMQPSVSSYNQVAGYPGEQTRPNGSPGSVAH